VQGLVAEMDRRFILERQRAGIEAAKKKGVYNSRKPSVPVEEVRKTHSDGKGPDRRGLGRVPYERVEGFERMRRPHGGLLEKAVRDSLIAFMAAAH
jgi:DNA invertase Pin-like site-specific DNA recombinase